MTQLRGLWYAAILVALVIPPCMARAGERQDVASVVQRYARDDASGALVAQGKLMMPDRVGIWGGARHSAPVKEEMLQQQLKWIELLARFPGLKLEVTIRDLQIRQWGDTAVATFYLVTRRIIPAAMPPDRVAELTAKPPVVKLCSHTLIKRNGTWKIAATAVLYLDRYPQ
jgi:hypothetical protein